MTQAPGDPPGIRGQTATEAAWEQLEREDPPGRLDPPEMTAPQEGMENLAPLVQMEPLVHRAAE